MDEYNFSGTLLIDDHTYVERPADTLLYQGLKNGKFCYVLNSRQTGKSSLRVRVMERLKQEGWQCASIDLSMIISQSSSEEQWYVGMLSRLQKNFNLNIHVGNWWREHELLSNLDRFTEFIESVLLKEILENIVIFIDEIETVLNLGFSTDDFFAFLRACYNQRVDNPEYKRLGFCLLGVAKPSDLIQDKRRTPFNIGYAIELTGIEIEQAKGKLTRGLEQKVDDPEGVLAEILKWTGGQPFLTQKLCHLVGTQSKNRTPNIQQLVKDKIINNWEFQDDPEHLGTIKDRLLKNSKKDPEKTIGLLMIYQKILDNKTIKAEKTLEHMELRLSGLVIQREGELRVFSSIYREVFDRDWVKKNIEDLKKRNSFKIDSKNQPIRININESVGMFVTRKRQKLNQYIYTLLLWLPLGFSLGITFHFLFNTEWLKSLFSAVITIFISPPVVKFIQGFQEELELAARIQGKESAKWIVTQTFSLISQLSWLTSRFESKYRQSLVDQYRELTIEGFRIGLPVLDLENVFVSLRVVPEIPEKITGAMIWRNGDSESKEIWDFLAQISKKKFQAFRRLAVIGPPGSGKTTLLKHLILIYAQNNYPKFKGQTFIPFLLYIRNIHEQIVKTDPPNLLELLTVHIRNLPRHQQLIPPPNWVEKQLKSGRCLVMLDGLDEIWDVVEFTQVSRWVNQQMANYPKASFILTSRPHSYCSAPVEQVGTVLEVLPFNSLQVKQFIQSWYLQTEIMSRAGRDTPAVRLEAKNNAEDLIKRIMENRAIADMAKNPLLVTMIATVHYCGSALPGRRVELYQKICDLLLGTREKAKKIKTLLTGEQKKSVLQVLALALMQRKTREFTPSQGQELIQEELQRVIGTKLTPSQFLKQIKELSGLLVERELGVYEFAHLSFQEYLAAARVKELQQDNLLIEKLHDPWWAETIRLYAAISDATNLIRQAIANPTVNSLTLANDCLQESLKVEPTIREQLEAMLEEGLESDEPEIAELVAEVKLSRRLNNLFEIEENLEIDTSYITYAEYQLFIDDWLKSGDHFQAGTAKRAITGITWNNALGFCAWLNSKAQLNGVNEQENQSIYYRLPTKTEAQDYPAKEHKELDCWTIDRSQTGEQGIRVVKAQLSPEYRNLTNYLSAEEWEKARQETESVMLQMAGQVSQEGLDGLSIEQISPQTLHIIELLWCQYSRGEYSWFAFDVITINDRGQQTQRKLNQARYFNEDLGNGITLDMVSIPGGKFMMGTEDEEIERLVKKYKLEWFRNEKPQHQVTVKSFFMGKYQVTQAQWKAVASLPKFSNHLDPNPSRFKGDNLPIENVSWEDAVEFCARLSRETGKEYRLPTEAEWEYACRSSTTTPFYFGETITGDLANYRARYIYANEPKGEYRQKTTPVGSFPPNAFGLYDMHGNVWEWCQDDWHDNYEGAPTDGSAWLSGNSNTKVMRGGSWFINPDYCRSAFRYFNSRVDRSDFIGFRVVCVAGSTT